MIKIEDKNRRNLPLPQSRVDEALPSYFETDNPQLINLLEKYYDFLDSDGQYAFSNSINEIILNRDVAQNSEAALDELITEIGDGLTSASFFKQPRLMAKLLGEFYRVKGTLVSIEGFFKGFFNEDIVIEYPKQQIFIVGESNVGYDSQKFIQDNNIYQIFSILVKSGVSVRDYETLYKKFVHPAGWHFQGEVSTANEVTLLPSSLASLDSIRPDIIPFASPIFSQASIEPQFEFNEITGLIDSGGVNIRIGLNQLISVYQNLTIERLGNFYSSIENLLTPNSFTFDHDLGTGIGGSNFKYNGYPRSGDSAENTTYFAADSAGHETQWFIANTFAPYDDLNTHITAFGDDISVSWNQNLDPTNATAAAASALQGTTTGSAGFFTYDVNHVNFDSDNFVNPKHLHNFGGFGGSNRSQKLPGLLIKGSILNPPTPEFYYRIDSDAYYIGTPGVAAGTYSSSLGQRFKISKLRWLGNDSNGVPDMSMTLETMDNDMFTRYLSDSGI